MIFGGPEQATVVGTLNGEEIDAAFERSNGCELDRWDRMAALLQLGIDARRRRADNETMRFVLSAALAAVLLVPATGAAAPPQVAGCQVFPASNVWNKPVGALPKHKRSARIIEAIGADKYLHADFGSGEWDGGPIGIPITVVDSSQPTSFVDFLYDDESDLGPYPIPPGVAIEGGRCRRRPARDHRRAGFLHPLRALQPPADAVGSGLRGNLGPRLERTPTARLDPGGRRGLPILPGLARYEEVESGVIGTRSALRSSAHGGPTSTPARRSPRATRAATSRPWGCATPALRLPGREPPLPGAGDPQGPQALRDDRRRQRLELVRLGAPDEGWSNDQLHTLHRVKGSDFRVVDTSKLRP